LIRVNEPDVNDLVEEFLFSLSSYLSMIGFGVRSECIDLQFSGFNSLFVISYGFSISVSVLSLNLGWQFECCCCCTNVCNGVVWEDAPMPTFGFPHMVLFEGWIWDRQMM
jgi:hypothetical protein